MITKPKVVALTTVGAVLLALLLLIAAPSAAAASSAVQAKKKSSSRWNFLRALQPTSNRGKGKGGPPSQPSTLDDADLLTIEPPSIECNVYLVKPAPVSPSNTHHATGEEDMMNDEEMAPEILHCILDDDDDTNDGSAPHILEIEGLDESELQRLKDEVTASGYSGKYTVDDDGSSRSRNHRYAFPGATVKKKKGNGTSKNKEEANVLSVPGRGPGSKVGGTTSHKYQANKVDKHHHPPNVANGYESNHRRQLLKRVRGSNTATNDPTRNLAIRKTGISTVLLLRIEAPDASTSCSHQDCAAHTFGGYDSSGVLDDMNMVSQSKDCSWGKFQFVPPNQDTMMFNNPNFNADLYPDLINGTATITFTENVVGVHHGTVLDWAIAAAPSLVGSLGQYDHVMVFMPPGVAMGGAAAWGYVGWKYSWYADGYSLETGVQLHELGHNLGLSHSGEKGASYGDGSCYMGYGGGDVKMCYNAPKSHWLGWYDDFHMLMDPIETPSKLVELVGLADYDELLENGNVEMQAVILRIDMYEGESLYLTYNRQEKMNIQVKEFADKVTVTKSNGPGQSWVEAGLSPGQRFHAPLVVGSGMMLEIIACDRATGTPDTFAVSIHVMGVGEPLCVPAQPIPSWGSGYGGSLTDGMVGYYTFDDDLLDMSGKDHHGVVGDGGTTSSFTNGVVGRALSLDGIDDFITLPNVNDFNFGVSDFTLTFWYRVSGDQSAQPAIITNKDWTSGDNVGWLVSSNFGPGSNGDDISINFSDGNGNRAEASQALDVAFNNWHFVAVRIKRGEKMSLLRSSGADYSLQEDSIDFVSGSVDTGLPVLIGASHGYSAKTKMDIDDLGIWRRALSSEEVSGIFMAGFSGGVPLTHAMDPLPPPEDPMPTTLVANYELEGDLSDTSGNDLDATLMDSGGAFYDSSDLGTHLNLNNVNVPAGTFLTLPDSDLLDFGNTTDFTISFWHRTTVDFATQSPNDPSIITNKNFGSGYNPGYSIGVGSNGRLEYNAGDGISRCDYDGPAGTMNDGEWHHVALAHTQGASRQMSIYLDGRNIVQKICGLASYSSGNAIRVGASWGYPSLYTGDVDKIMIYRSALSHANVFALYDNGRGLAMTGSPTSSLEPTRNPTRYPTALPSSPPTPKPTESPTTAWPSSPPTPQPTDSPISCEGEYFDVRCCGSESQKQADYRGMISTTVGDIECQAWSSQSPHGHTRTPGSYPNSGLESNYCRNPDGEPRAWCYTSSSSKRWDYCDVPNCGTMEPTPNPTPIPSSSPTTAQPTTSPTDEPTLMPTKSPTLDPTMNPTTAQPSQTPTAQPTLSPSVSPSQKPTYNPSLSPSNGPTAKPTSNPSKSPITPNPTENPTQSPTTSDPTLNPTDAPVTPKPTTSPTPEPECSGIDNTCCGSFWLGARQADYRGTKSTTVGGIECQAWSSQLPHRHGVTPANYPSSGLDSNYCRNPDGEARAWCYTSSSSKRWDHCDVLSCPACEAGNPNQCGCSEVKQADYRGTQSQTVGGYECQNWDSQFPHGHSRTPASYPNAGLEANYCRNPDGEPASWCYTNDPSKRWDYCAVPVCGA